MIKELSRQLDDGIRHYLFSLAQGCCFPCYSKNICLACKRKEFFPLKPGVHCRPKKICTSLVISIMGKANLFSTHDLQYITFLFLKHQLWEMFHRVTVNSQTFLSRLRILNE